MVYSPFPVYRTYEPSERQKLFHSVKNFAGSSVVLKGAIGGLGGGKSTACEQEQALICLNTPNGKSIAMRKSMNRSEISVLDDYQKLLGGAAKWVSSRKCFEFDNGHKLIVCPADEWDRFGSAQFVSFYIQEAQEVDYRIFDTLTQRLRDPAGVVHGIPYYTGLFCARGVKRAHWIYERFVKNAWDLDSGREERHRAKNPDFVYCRFTTYDNSQHLDEIAPGYIQNQIRHHEGDTAWIKMFIEGEFGFDIEGRPVFECFKPDAHIAQITADPSLPIHRGWDFGYNRPAVVWCQYDRTGRFLVLKELCPTGVSREELCGMVATHQKIWWPDRHPSQYRDYGDIAGTQVNTATDQHDVDYVESYFGTSMEYRAARVQEGLEVLRGLMVRNTKSGSPRFAIDESCERLIDACQGAYYYRLDKTDERPIKGEGYDDVVDATRYVAQLIVEESFVDGTVAERGRWKSKDFAKY